GGAVRAAKAAEAARGPLRGLAALAAPAAPAAMCILSPAARLSWHPSQERVTMLSVNRALALTSALLLPIAPRASAQGWVEPIRPLPRGAIEKVRSAVQVAVAGRVARVTVEEWFRNAGPVMDEGSYLYPLPGEAVFSDFSLWQGDRELKGEPMDAAQARAIYEEIVRRKQDPALIELAGHG